MPDAQQREPEDIFASTEEAKRTKGRGAVRAQVPPRAFPQENVSPQGISAITRLHRTPWLWILVGGLCVAGLVAGGAWWYMNVRVQPSGTDHVVSGSNTSSESAQSAGSEEALNNSLANVSTPLDTDGDGLSDQDEAYAGTNPRSPDTDGDGLFDREEVNVWHTDPLNRDTDGDGFSDGDEVRNGFDPKGPGKILDINSAPAQ